MTQRPIPWVAIDPDLGKSPHLFGSSLASQVWGGWRRLAASCLSLRGCKGQSNFLKDEFLQRRSCLNEIFQYSSCNCCCSIQESWGMRREGAGVSMPCVYDNGVERGLRSHLGTHLIYRWRHRNWESLSSELQAISLIMWYGWSWSLGLLAPSPVFFLLHQNRGLGTHSWFSKPSTGQLWELNTYARSSLI